MEHEVDKRMKRAVAFVVCFFSVLIVFISVFINIKSTTEAQDILEGSIRSQLRSITVAAREMVDVEKFMAYNSVQDTRADAEAYDSTLLHLRNLCAEAGAEYIYALKEIDGEYYFVFDTDTEDEEIFIPYELAEVHRQAFAGHDAIDVMNVEDAYGSFNTGAIPIWHGGQVVGIICTDIEDEFLLASRQVNVRNMVLLVVSLLVAVCALIVLMLVLMRRLRTAQSKLFRLAHHDALTDLPNRQSLMEYLEKISAANEKMPYALMFIDLDNFKQVNDNAGHDAGDELLVEVASYLNSGSGDIMSFRPSAGVLTIAARVGGDEFVQVVPGIASAEQAAQAAQKLLDGFAQHDFGRLVEKYGVGLSVGVALYPYHTENYHVLIKYADIAMYHAKRAGKGSYRIYQDEMEQKPEK